jgi:two-component system sensor histidine kinase EvgS
VWQQVQASAVALLLLAAGGAPAADPPPGTRVFFHGPRLAAPLGLGPEVLTAQERAFIATLPELRVAIPLPAVRPYETVGADGEVSGIHPDMLSHLANAFGLRVRPVLFPTFGAALEALRTQQADLMLTLGYTAARAASVAYTLGVTPLSGALFTRGNGTGR